MVIQILIEVNRTTHKQNDNFNKKNILKNTEQIIELKNTISTEKFNRRVPYHVDQMEERI